MGTKMVSRRRFIAGGVAAVIPTLPMLPTSARAQVVQGLLVLTVGVCGCLIVLYLIGRPQPQPTLHRIALEKSTNHGPWMIVMIVEVMITEDTPQYAFAEEIIYTNGPTIYRVREVPQTPEWAATTVEPRSDIVPGVKVFMIPKQ
jgi:hypothetical protein